MASLACQSAIPPYTVNVPPRVVDVRPPRSVAFVRGDVPLDGARSAIERAIPAEVTGSRRMNVLALHDVDVSWHLARHPVALRAERDGLVLEIAILGEVGLQGEGVRCHANDAGVVFRVATSPTLRPGGELALDHLQWKPELRGTLQCGLFPVPVGALGDAIVEPLAGALAKGVEQIRIPMGPALEAALVALRTPRSLELGDKGGEACLDLDPAQFVPSPVGGAGGEMTLKIGVDVAPRVTLDPCPAPSARGSTHEGAALVRVQPLRDEFAVALAVAVPYTELEALVAPQLVGHHFGDGSNTVTIDGFEAGDASGHVLARLPIRGVLTGMLYLWGTPVIAQEGSRWILRVPDLHVALESESFFSRLVLVVLQFKNGGLEAMMRNLVKLDVTDRVAKAQASLSGKRTLTSGPPAVGLMTELTRVQPGEVSSQQGMLLVEPVVTGKASIEIGP
jgi:hypothetical protein